MNGKENKQGKAIFVRRTAFTEVKVRSGSYSGDIVKEKEEGKGKRRQVREGKGKGKKEKKTTMQ